MAKREKKAPDPPAGVPAWMATFSDLVTLLLTFFVMLMAMASFEDSSDMDTLLESLREALAELGFGDGLVSMIFGENLSDQQRRDVTVRPKQARPREGQAADRSDAVVQVSRDPAEVRLTLDDDVYFASGSSSLRPGARSRLRTLGLTLSEHDVSLRIEGHTDREGDESANWELSVLRAMTVAEVLRTEGRIPSERVQARGLGPFHPVVSLEADRARNRRIELVMTGNDIQTAEALEAVKRLGADDE